MPVVSLLRLGQRIQKELPYATPLQITGSRVVSQRFANQNDVLSLTGSINKGGRFNVKGQFGASYLAGDVTTALAELEYYASQAGVPLSDWLPRTVIAVEVKVIRALDLSDRTVLKRLRLSKRSVMSEWEADQARGITPLTQVVGRAARDAGFEAVVYPSARHFKGRNIAVFLDRLDPTSSVQLINPQELP